MKKLSLFLMCLVLLMISVAAMASPVVVDQTLILPNSLQVIEESAFEGTEAVECVVLPEGVIRIESRAFAQSSIKEVAFPKSIEFIADDAFDGCNDWTPVVYYESYAHEWCEAKGLDCEVLDAPAPELSAPVISLITAVDTTGLKLHWEAVDGAASYDVYRSETGDVASFVKIGSTSELAYTDNVLEPGTEYWYYIQAKSADGILSEASEVVKAETDQIKYRALLIGNTYSGASNELPGPDNDLAGMTAMLRLQTATPYTITPKLNLTTAQIKAAITQAYAGADSTDVSLFYYSGHGSQDGHLCGTNSTYLSSQELRECLDQVPGTKIVLLDCCYSGYHINKSADSTQNFEKAFNEAVISAFATQKRSYLAASEYIVLTACSKRQSSVSAGTFKNGQLFYFGAYTYTLVKGSGFNILTDTETALWADQAGDGNNQVSLGEAYDYVVDVVKNELNFEQDAQYYGNTDFVLWAQKS